MHEHDPHAPQGPTEAELKESIAAGYEKNDVSIPVLMQWGFGLLIFLVATAAAMLLLFEYLRRQPVLARNEAESIMRPEHSVPPTGSPVLQDNPSGDPRPDNNPHKGVDNIREFRRDEEIRMYEYARQDGDIQIPIDRAMELVLGRLEVQQPGEPATGINPTPEMRIHRQPPPAPGAADPAAPGGG